MGKMTAALISVFFALPLAAEELPKPTYANSTIISIEHSPADAAEADYIKGHFNFGLYAWPSFSICHIDPDLPWHYMLRNAATGIQPFKDAANAYIQAARLKGVKLHLVVCSGLARNLAIYREAKEEDVRNAQWFNDNKIASDTQIADPAVLSGYVFGTLSRYARKLRANVEAKGKAMAAFFKASMTKYPQVLIAVSGWGEAELSPNRGDFGKAIQDYFCDYSPFAVLEFRDWIQRGGLYDDAKGLYKGQGWSGGGAKYQGTAGLAKFNADYKTAFKSWDLRYYDWGLEDAYDGNPTDAVNADPHRIPFTDYKHGKMMPKSGPNYVAGGFDPPRKMTPGAKFWDLWNLFRESMVGNFVADLAKWAKAAGIPADKWYTHQIPADYLFGTNPGMAASQLNGRYFASASPLRTADIRPNGSLGATLYDIKFPTWFVRTTQYAVPAIKAMAANWAAMEYDAETYPYGFTVTPSPPGPIFTEYMKLYSGEVHIVNFWRWIDGSGEHQIKGTNKETALRNFVNQIRDTPRTAPPGKVFDPPRVAGLSAKLLPDKKTIRLELTGKIWPGAAWAWKDWGDFERFEVVRSTSPDFEADAAGTTIKTADYFLNDLPPAKGTAYYYRVRAVNIKGTAGPFSRTVTVFLPN